jgi:ATP-dependent Clp protease ATP-binding subunit ClpA
MDNLVKLDAKRSGTRAEELDKGLRARVIGQDRALKTVVSMYEVFSAGLSNPARPIGSFLFLGPTGSGKTKVVESAAEIFFGKEQAMMKINCGEYQHSHEIAKLIGSPPGYLGHRETKPIFAQASLAACCNADYDFTLILFDEIEKASDALWQLMLGILDKGQLSMGDGATTDFRRTIIFMTSNLGAREIKSLQEGGIGFALSAQQSVQAQDDTDQKIYRTASDAAKKRFSPEFINRIDKIVVFRTLTEDHLRQILDLELALVQKRIDELALDPFSFQCTQDAKDFLLAEGLDPKYGARHLKRSIERFLVHPLARLIATQQVVLGSKLVVHLEDGELEFYRDDVNGNSPYQFVYGSQAEPKVFAELQM